MKMFVITVRAKVIGQINVKMPKRRGENLEADQTEGKEVDQIKRGKVDLVAREVIEKKEENLKVVVVLLIVNQVKVSQSIILLFYIIF